MISHRRVIESDLETILRWRNLSENRSKMLTSHTITWPEHLDWWSSLGQNKQKVFILTAKEIDIGVVNFFEKTGRLFWGFYLSDSAQAYAWETLFNIEVWVLKYSKYSLKLEKLYCETLLSNQVVWKIHKRFGFKDEMIQNYNNTLLQAIDLNEVSF